MFVRKWKSTNLELMFEWIHWIRSELIFKILAKKKYEYIQY